MAETALSPADRAEVVAEFQQHHALRPNAEELISANATGFSSALRAAQYESIDAEATAELDLDDVGGMTAITGETVSDVGEPISAAVRGNAIIVVVVQPDGRSTKLVVPANDQYKAPTETPAEAVARTTAMSNVELTKEITDLRDQMAVELAELRAEREATVGEAVAAKSEELKERAAEAAAEAEEAADAEAEASASSGGGGGGASAAGYPRSHDDLDALLDGSSADEPEGWEDMKVGEKTAYLKQQGVKPDEE